MKDFVAKAPKGYRKETINLRLDNALLQKVDRCAYKSQVSRNQYITECILYAMENAAEDAHIPPE